jgi:hypothetical protein
MPATFRGSVISESIAAKAEENTTYPFQATTRSEASTEITPGSIALIAWIRRDQKGIPVLEMTERIK